MTKTRKGICKLARPTMRPLLLLLAHQFHVPGLPLRSHRHSTSASGQADIIGGRKQHTVQVRSDAHVKTALVNTGSNDRDIEQGSFLAGSCCPAVRRLQKCTDRTSELDSRTGCCTAHETPAAQKHLSCTPLCPTIRELSRAVYTALPVQLLTE